MRRIQYWIGDPVAAFAPVVAVILALAIGALMLLALGTDPIVAYGAMIDGAFGSTNGFMRTLTRATPLLLVAVGICIAFRGGMINIGAEGQLFVGAIAATAVAVGLGNSLPSVIMIPLTMLVGFLAGAVWGGIPGVLKARFEVNEILSTVMMNEIAIQLLLFLLTGPLIDPEQVAMGTRIPQSAQLPESSWIPRISHLAFFEDLLPRSSQLHVGFFIAIVIAILVYVMMWRTTLGYRIRAVGLNMDAARYAGIKVPVYMALALLLSGGIAGLAGAVEVSGLTHRVVEGFAVGYGFSGIVVALFGRLHPVGAIPASILFGALLVGADKMQRTVQIPSAMIIALQGLIVIFVVSSEIWIRRRARQNIESPPPVVPSVETEPQVIT